MQYYIKAIHIITITFVMNNHVLCIHHRKKCRNSKIKTLRVTSSLEANKYLEIIQKLQESQSYSIYIIWYIS